MSPPPPCTVQVPLLRSCEPAGAAAPTSVQVQVPGQTPPGVVPVLVIATPSMVQVAAKPWFQESLAMPASSEPVSAGSVVSDPGTLAQVCPSPDVDAW